MLSAHFTFGTRVLFVSAKIVFRSYFVLAKRSVLATLLSLAASGRFLWQARGLGYPSVTRTLRILWLIQMFSVKTSLLDLANKGTFRQQDIKAKPFGFYKKSPPYGLYFS